MLLDSFKHFASCLLLMNLEILVREILTWGGGGWPNLQKGPHPGVYKGT